MTVLCLLNISEHRILGTPCAYFSQSIKSVILSEITLCQGLPSWHISIMSVRSGMAYQYGMVCSILGNTADHGLYCCCLCISCVVICTVYSFLLNDVLRIQLTWLGCEYWSIGLLLCSWGAKSMFSEARLLDAGPVRLYIPSNF